MPGNFRDDSGKGARQKQERREAFGRTIPKAKKRVLGRSTTRETPLHIRARGVEVDDTLDAYMRARAGFKLGRYALHVSRISVRLEDVAGPKGAPMYACRFKVLLPGTREVVVSELDASVRASFDTAVDATERAVRRLLQRGRAKPVRSGGR